MGAPSDILLAAQRLTVRLAHHRTPRIVLSDLSLELERGSITALLGESGAGKSLFALAVLGLLPQAAFLKPEGEIWFNGTDLLSLTERQLRAVRGSKITMIFQEPRNSFNPVLSLGDQLMEVARIHLHLETPQAKERVFAAMEEVQLSDVKKIYRQYPHELSGGMLQRASIAMAILSNPLLLIADEPTTALDVTIQAQILELLAHLAKKRGMTLLLITHDLNVVAEIADHVAVLYGGEIVEISKSRDLFNHPAHPYTASLFKARHFSPREERLLAYPERPPQGVKGCPFAHRCPSVMGRCTTQRPSLYALQESGHRAACFIHEQEHERGHG